MSTLGGNSLGWRVHGFWYIEPPSNPRCDATEVQIRVILPEGPGYAFTMRDLQGREVVYEDTKGEARIYGTMLVTLDFVREHLRVHKGFAQAHVLIVEEIVDDKVAAAIEEILPFIEHYAYRHD